MNAKEPKDPNEMKMKALDDWNLKKGLIDWNELTEISFQTSRLAQDIVKNKESLASHDQIEVANQILTGISGNIQLIQQAVELHLKQFPDSYTYIHPYLKCIIPSAEELEEDYEEEDEFIGILVKNR
jgi:hypothetical protein